MNGSLLGLIHAKDFAKTAVRRMKANLVWALLYNAVALPLASGLLYPLLRVRLTPSMAGAMMALSSLSVVLSSYHLTWYRKAQLSPEVISGSNR
jgi:cation transport ATPase